jgi:hypothetical protein
MREELEASDNHHNWEAAKQLFLKIISTTSVLDDPPVRSPKKDEKRKEL